MYDSSLIHAVEALSIRLARKIEILVFAITCLAILSGILGTLTALKQTMIYIGVSYQYSVRHTCHLSCTGMYNVIKGIDLIETIAELSIMW